jgi:hypothetical protein
MGSVGTQYSAFMGYEEIVTHEKIFIPQNLNSKVSFGNIINAKLLKITKSSQEIASAYFEEDFTRLKNLITPLHLLAEESSEISSIYPKLMY